MLVLLMSMFFSGFFLPLENFWTPIQLIGYALPLTHAIDGFQNVMLRARAPSDFAWLMLGIIAALTFVGSALMTQWRFRRLD
jgi:ABC-2 type transport system permease protein